MRQGPLLKQLFSIHCSVAPLHKTTVPALYVLMSGKSEELYTAVLERLVDIAEEHGISLDPKHILTEKEMVNAFQTVFPDSLQIGCFFHWSQALWRHVETLGIGKDVAHSSALKEFYNNVRALAFLPPAAIPKAFNLLAEQTPAKMKDWIQYVGDTYVLGRVVKGRKRRMNPLFSPDLWSVYNNILKDIARNTNNQESWHARLGRLITEDKTRILILIKELISEQKAAQGCVRQVLAGMHTPRKPASVLADKRLFSVAVNYTKFETLDYLTAIATHLGA